MELVGNHLYPAHPPKGPLRAWRDAITEGEANDPVVADDEFRERVAAAFNPEGGSVRVEIEPVDLSNPEGGGEVTDPLSASLRSIGHPDQIIDDLRAEVARLRSQLQGERCDTCGDVHDGPCPWDGPEGESE